MEAFSFLFGITFLWIMFATVQDLRTREVANWLTFSLIAVALAYRGFVAAFSGAWGIWWWGVIGCAVFVLLAHAFYYGRVFAGGDAKLLMGTGIALPYQSLNELILWGSTFLFALFFCGALYTLVYSVRLVVVNRKAFGTVFFSELKKQRWLFVFSVVVACVLALVVAGNDDMRLLGVVAIALVLVIPLLYAYLQSIEHACLIRLRKPKELREGDWLVKTVRVGNKKIAASVHGLSSDEIRLLQRYRKQVMIKEGVPFVPAFLIAYGFMGYVALTGTLDLSQFLLSLSSQARAF
jgi:Flp pilus assembly protein protease CpaA